MNELKNKNHIEDIEVGYLSMNKWNPANLKNEEINKPQPQDYYH